MDSRKMILDFLSPVADPDNDIWESPPPEGREPMRKIADALEAAGTTIASPVSEWENYGWDFAFNERDVVIQCMLQWAGEWLMLIWPIRSLGDKLRGRRHLDELEGGCVKVTAAIEKAYDIASPPWLADE